jgi:hypothetical protein
VSRQKRGGGEAIEICGWARARRLIIGSMVKARAMRAEGEVVGGRVVVERTRAFMRQLVQARTRYLCGRRPQEGGEDSDKDQAGKVSI